MSLCQRNPARSLDCRCCAVQQEGWLVALSAGSSKKAGLSHCQHDPARRLDCRFVSAIQQKGWILALSAQSSKKAGLSLCQRDPTRRLDCRIVSAIRQDGWIVALSTRSSKKAGLSHCQHGSVRVLANREPPSHRMVQFLGEPQHEPRSPPPRFFEPPRFATVRDPPRFTTVRDPPWFATHHGSCVEFVLIFHCTIFLNIFKYNDASCILVIISFARI